MTTFILLISAPLVSGIILKIKNKIRMRKGPGIFQPYYNALKLFSKEEVISKYASWIFFAAPVIVFSSSVCALIMVMAVKQHPAADNGLAILIAAFFVLGLGRFFLALAGLDTGSSFGGMGSSREMFISSFAEPVVFIAAFVLFTGGAPAGGARVSNSLAGIALFMATLAETSRIPIDNRETHLELTMVHEAMALEYSGRSLALIELAAHIKQMIFFVLLSWYIFPAGIIIVSAIVAVVEMSIAKMRLFRVVDFLGFAFFIALVASIAAGAGL